MNKHINCIYLKHKSFCKCKQIERSWFGIGPRECQEYIGKVRVCSFKELDVTEKGRYLVKFKEAETDMFGRSMPNDFKSARVSFPFEDDNQTVFVNWDNGNSARIDKKYLKFKNL